MSIAISPSAALFEIPALRVRRFSVDEYHRLISAHVLGEDDAVELLEGWIVPKMPHLPRHDATVDLRANRFRRGCPPVRASAFSPRSLLGTVSRSPILPSFVVLPAGTLAPTLGRLTSRL